MARKQESFSSLLVFTTSRSSTELTCDDSMHRDYGIFSGKAAQVQVISDEIESMISAWEASDLAFNKNENPSLETGREMEFDTKNSRNCKETENPVSSSGIGFEPSRRIPSSLLPLTLSPPATFRRSSKRPSGTLSKERISTL